LPDLDRRCEISVDVAVAGPSLAAAAEAAPAATPKRSGIGVVAGQIYVVAVER
jgi:hypothetical protein